MKTITNNNHAVPGLARGIAIIDLIAESNLPMTASEISKVLVLPKSSMHGLLKTLVDTNVLYKDDQQKYYLSAHTISWSDAIVRRNNIAAVFKSEVAKMSELAPYTLTLTRLEGDGVIYIAHQASNAPLGFSFTLGLRLPAVFTATGKAILSTLDDEEINKILREWPKPLTSKSVKNIDDLMKEIEAIRINKYSIDNGQIREGMYCIGTAISDAQGKALGGIAISFIKEEYTEINEEVIVKSMKKLGKNIKVQMGIIS